MAPLSPSRWFGLIGSDALGKSGPLHDAGWNFMPKVRPKIAEIPDTVNSEAVHAHNWLRAASIPVKYVSAVPK